jgi:hypothetical protein
MGHITPTWPTANQVGWDGQMNSGLGTVVTQVNSHDDTLAGLIVVQIDADGVPYVMA